MHTNTDINAVINKAKRQRADYIISKVYVAALPIALAAIISLVLASLAGEPSQDQAEMQRQADISAHHG